MSDREDGDEDPLQSFHLGDCSGQLSPETGLLHELTNPGELLSFLPPDESVSSLHEEIYAVTLDFSNRRLEEGLRPDLWHRENRKPEEMIDSGDGDEERPQSSLSIDQTVSLLSEETFPVFIDEPGPSNRWLEGEPRPDMWHRANVTLYRPPPGELSEAQVEHLVSHIRSRGLYFAELDLSRNSVKGPVAELVLGGLSSASYTVKTLRLSDCILSERCLDSLASALTWLMELDLSGNKHLMDSGVERLSAGLKSQTCSLWILRLVCCGLTESSCASLSSALESNQHLKVLDLSGNSVKDSGVELLCSGLRSPSSVLEVLSLSCCDLSESSCYYLASTLKCRLIKLDLSLNQLQDAGIKLLSDGLKSHDCPLNVLRLVSCGVSDEGCAALVSALKSRPSSLTELDLSGNQLQTEGMKLLSDLVKSPLCILKTLRVEYGRDLVSLEAKKRWPIHPQSYSSVGGRSLSLDSYREQPFIHIHGSQQHGSFQHLDLDEFKPYPFEFSGLGSPWRVHFPMVGASMFPGPTIPPPTVPSPSIFRIRDLTVDCSQKPPKKDETQLGTTDLALDPQTANAKPDLSDAKTKDVKPTLHFTPNVLRKDPGGGASYRFRAPCPGLYRCVLTKLLFTMSGEGELLYRVVQWDENVLQAAGKTPASPLYNIQCLEGSVSQLHLPHCGPDPGLSVVHITDEGMSVLKPLEITETHVVVDVPHLSAFGLVLEIIKRFLKIQNPINGQILLFHRPALERKRRKVNVFLLPDNVPLPEVKSQQENAEFIEATCSCVFIRGHSYSLQCDEAYKIQPKLATFDFRYGPNYHPTFEIRLTFSKEEATVTVRDKDYQSVWEYHMELSGLRSAPSSSTAPEPVSLPVQTDRDEPPAHQPASVTEREGPDPSGQTRNAKTPGEDEEKLFRVRTEFIDRVSSSVLKDLLDKLLQSRVINVGELESVQSICRADKARQLVDMVLRKGNAACGVLIQTLRDLDPFVSETLQLS